MTSTQASPAAEEHASRAGGGGALPPGGNANADLLQTYVSLLILVLLTFGVAGLAEPGRWEQVILTVVMGAALVITLRAAAARPVARRSAAALAIACGALSFGEALAGSTDQRAARVAACLLVVLAPPALLVGVVRRIRSTRSVTVEAVIGVLCVYMLMGLFYTFLYGAIDRLSATDFFAHGAEASTAHCLYFSFTTLTTVGYGDLTAAGNLGHTLAVSEALLGQVYLVTIVSLIVSNLGRRG